MSPVNSSLIDTHCHLDFPDATAPWQNPEEQIQAAREANVMRLINVGCDLKSSLSGLDLALRHENVWCTFGVHPNDASRWNHDVEEQFSKKILEDQQKPQRKIVSIGEIGLDYFRKSTPESIQKEAFIAQLKLAKQFELPVVVHCRDAFDDTFSILEQEKMRKVVFHCFSGDRALAHRIWSNGWLTSFTAVISYPKNDELRAVVQECPADRYFIETDAPFLPHQSIRGQRNQPAHLPKLAQSMVEIRNEPFEKVAGDSTRNAQQFFGF